MSLCLCLGTILHFSSAGQCSNTLSTRTYDSLITGTGYGNYRISFPQWSPDSGTLVSAKINARVSVQYKFSLKNVDVNPSIYTLWVGREDYITSPAMSAPYDNITEQKIGIYPLDPGNSVSSGFFAFLDNYNNTDSITGQVAGFIGLGKVAFAYSPVTYTTLRSNNNSSYNYNASVLDTVHFSLTYLYCKTITLASSLTRFTAAPEGPATVRLSWTMTGEQAGRRYEIQKSRDGLHFETVADLPSAAGNNNMNNYEYVYTLPGGTGETQGKWYFRLKMYDGHGGSTYSEIKTVMMGAITSNGVFFYPNPAVDFVNIVFDQPVAGNWQVDIFTAGGSLVQSETFLHTRAARVDFRRKLATGTYFIRATDGQAQKTIVSSLLVSQQAH